MAFTTGIFAAFFIPFFLAYWLLCPRRADLQNGMLLIASYAIYVWADGRMALLLAAASLVAFAIGKRIDACQSPEARRRWALVGLFVHLGVLLLFKYCGCFADQLAAAAQRVGWSLSVDTFRLVMPLGLSFYTFRILGYLFDVQRRKIAACGDLSAFLVFVSFFPCIVAGPIDRAKPFLGQLAAARVFDADRALAAVRQFIWGLFKKLVIADGLDLFTGPVFAAPVNFDGIAAIVVTFYYAVQLYADFSGYSDMALGISRLLGVEVARNFDHPFFARNIADFWRRWHMSLTSWLTDYLFTPVSIQLRDHGRLGLGVAIGVTFLVIGAWHGAKWTFVLFGAIHALAYLPLIAAGTMGKKLPPMEGRLVPSFRDALGIGATFAFVACTFVIFRLPSMAAVMEFFSRWADVDPAILASLKLPNSRFLLEGAPAAVTLLAVDWLSRGKETPLSTGRHLFWKTVLVLVLILVAGSFVSEQAFIYRVF
jgi:D-alanyl-lipoteichoic acid acyltransferase DltB (MBOAT superfamily)